MGKNQTNIELKKNFSVKAIVKMATLGFLINSLSAAAGEIKATEGFGTEIKQNGNVFDITTSKIKDGNAFNSFDSFNLDANKIANLHFGSKGGAEAENLFNFVKNRINVDGTVNAIRNNRIGGNLYFLSSEGIIVGKTGVINTGSLHLLTPKADAFNKALEQAKNSELFPGIVPEKGKITIPLNPNGSIVVHGKINATNDIRLDTAKIQISKEGKLKTGVIDFSNLVNIDGAANLTDVELTVTRDSTKGDIILSAYADTSSRDESLTNSIAKGNGGALIRKNITAGVESEGEIEAAKDVKISATVTNGTLKKVKDDEEFYKSEAGIAKLEAKIDIKSGKIKGKNIEIKASSKNYYDTPASIKGGEFALSALTGSASPINIKGSLALLSSKADINIGKTAILESDEKTEINAFSGVRTILGTSTTPLKIKNFYLKDAEGKIPNIAAAYVDAESESKINIEGNIKSKGAIDISSKSTNTIDANTNAGTIKNDNKVGISVLVTKGLNKSSVNIMKGAELNSALNTNINSETESSLRAKVAGTIGDNANAIIAANISEYKSSSDIKIGGTINSSGKVDINSKNIVKESLLNTTSKIGSSKLINEVVMESDHTKKLLEAIKNRFGGNDEKTKKSFTDLFGVGASATIVIHDNSSNIKIEKDAKISSNSGTAIKALNEIQNIHVETSSATLATREEENKKLSVGAALFYGNIKNNSSINIEDNAQIISKGEIDINSESKIEYNNVSRMLNALLDKVQDLKSLFSKSGDFKGNLGTLDSNRVEAFEGLLKDFTKALDGQPDLLTNGEKVSVTLPNGEVKTGTAPEIISYLKEEIQKFGNSLPDVNNSSVGEDIKAFVSDLTGIFKEASEFASIGNYSNFYTYTSAATNPNRDTSVVSGTVSWLDLQNHSKVNIGKNVQIKADKDLNVYSNNKTETVTIVGKAGLIKGSNDSTTVGGSMNIQNINTSSSIISKEKAKLEGQNLDIQANSNVFNVASSLNAGGGGNSINGMLSYIQGSSKNLISIDDETILTAKNGINIASKNNTSITNVAGAIALGQKNAATGLGIAINNFEVDNKVAIEDNDNGDSQYAKNSGEVTIKTQTFDVEAKTTGKINAVSVAGGISKAGSDGSRGIFDSIGDKVDSVKNGASNTLGLLTNKITDFLNKGQGSLGSNLGGASQGGNNSTSKNLVAPKFSLGAAGSTSLNLINKSTNVLIDGANINFTEGRKSFNVSAKDSSFIGSWSGAAALNFNFVDYGEKNISAGIAGAAAVNKINSSVSTILKNNIITGAKDIGVNALSGGTQVAAGLGLGIAKDGGGHGKNFQLGTSASINLVENNVKSILENNKINGNAEKTNVDLTAYNSDTQITGGLNLQLGESKGSLGASLAISKLKNNVTAEIKGGTYSNINNINVKGLLATTQISSAVAAGITGSGDSGGVGVFEGAASANEISNSINSTIDGANINNANNVNVIARDTKSSSDLARESHSQIREAAENNKDYLTKRGIDSVGESYQVEESKNSTKKDGSLIISAALAGSATNKASAGLGVSVNLINNNFNAGIKNSTITSANSVNVNSQANTTMVNVAVGAAVSTSSFGGTGSVSWQEINNGVISKIENSTINTNALDVQAKNEIFGVNVAGGIAGGKAFAAGAVLANSSANNKTAAYILGSNLNSLSPNGLKLKAKAENEATITTVAAGAAVSAKNIGVGGTIAVNRVSSETESLIDKTANKNSKIENVNSIDISATDKAKLNTISGSINGGKTAGVGGTIAYTDIGGSSSNNNNAKYIVKAGLNNTDIKTVGTGNINVQAKDNTVVNTIAGGISASGSVAVQGSSATALINKKVNSLVENTNINRETQEKNTNLNIIAENSSTITTNASVVAAAPGGTGIGLGAGVSVNRIIQDTSAILNNSNVNVKNTIVKSKVSSEIKNIGIGAGVGVGGTGVGLSGSTVINKITNNNIASIKNTNLHAKGNVGLIAESDATISSYAGLASAGQNAAIGASSSVNEIYGDTKANISNSNIIADEETADTIDTQGEVDKVTDKLFGNIDINSSLAKDRKKSKKKGIVIDSSSTTTIKTLLATAGGAVQSAVGGTVNVNVISGLTEASITDSSLKAKNISIHSGDYTSSIGVLGSATGALRAGVGASSDTNIITRNTKTTINGNKTVIEGENINIDAEAKQGISSYTIGVAGAGVGAGVAGTISVNKLEGKTEVDINEATITAKNNINILAKHQSNISVGNASAGFAGKGAGIGAAVSVNKDNSETAVRIKNSNITADNKLDINSSNETNMQTAIVAAGVGIVGAGVSGTVSVNNITNKVILDINNSKLTAKNSDVNIKAHNKIKTALNSGGGSAGLAAVTGVVSVNTVDSSVLTKINNNSSIISEKGNANISATEERDIKQIVANAGLGGVALGANVLINNFGTVVLDKKDVNVSKIFEEINKEQKQKFDNKTLKLLQEKGIEKTNNEYSVEADKGGRTNNGIVIDIKDSSIKGKNVNILAQEKNDVSSTSGGGTLGVVAASGSVSISNIKRNLGINIANSNISANENLKIEANTLGKVNSKVFQGTSGALSLGAAYAEINSYGRTVVNIENSKLQAKDTNILAKDSSELKSEATGVTAGVVAAGAIISKANNSGSIEIEVSNSTFNKDFNEAKQINIKTEKANKTTATSDGGSAGIASGIGVVANAKDEGVSRIDVNNGNNLFNASTITLEALNKMQVLARTGSVSGAILGNVGVSKSEAIASGQALINVSSGNIFKANNINIGAKVGSLSPNEKIAKSSTVSNGGGGIAGGEVNTATTESSTNVFVNVGKQNYQGKNTFGKVDTLNIYGENNTSTQTDINSLNIGGISAQGSNKAISKNLSKTVVTAEGGSADKISLNAISISENSSSTSGNGGGFVAGGSIITDNLNRSRTILNVSGEWDTDISFNAKVLDKNTINIKSDSTKGGFVGNNGINIVNTLQGVTELNITDNTRIHGQGRVNVDAVNDLDVNISAEGAAYGGIGKSNASIKNTVIKDAKINLGKVNIDALGQQTYQAFTNAKINIISKLYAAGAVSLTHGSVNNSVNLLNSVKVGKGAILKTKDIGESIILAASDNSKIRVESFAETKGAGGEALTDVENSVNKKNEVVMEGDKNSKGSIDSAGILKIYAGKDKTGKESRMDLEVISHAYNYAFISKARPTLKNEVNIKNSLEFGENVRLGGAYGIDSYNEAGQNTIRTILKKYTWYSKKNVDDYIDSKGGADINRLINKPLSSVFIKSIDSLRKDFDQNFTIPKEIPKLSKIVSLPNGENIDKGIEVKTEAGQIKIEETTSVNKEAKNEEVQEKKVSKVDNNDNLKSINDSLEEYSAKKDIEIDFKNLKVMKFDGKTVFLDLSKI